MPQTPELEPRVERSSDGLENAEMRVKWFESQKAAFTPEAHALALCAMQNTVEQYRARAASLPQLQADK